MTRQASLIVHGFGVAVAGGNARGLKADVSRRGSPALRVFTVRS
ncbi:MULTISPECIES: hypothetical protein [unclassified Paenibacillus]|nr:MULTISPECIES: hypothetical protein [unclassified Paenibacillus]MDF9840795.1 hypothetical protein [Paenibacillus sp. PastF-2]MDF9847378.1 hypothetical protein [Paenibacillus sp. PastM-2]MDF9854044.1 hypothetical protein [Paenibacillus sp. PastF-1]MDH6479317.1 hypothetical protein [Paenibacillus sp. PastH-2]